MNNIKVHSWLFQYKKLTFDTDIDPTVATLRFFINISYHTLGIRQKLAYGVERGLHEVLVSFNKRQILSRLQRLWRPVRLLGFVGYSFYLYFIFMSFDRVA